MAIKEWVHRVPVLFCMFISMSAAASPFGMTWSTKNFGPDGPWQAVQISIGTPGQSIALYPGGSFRSHFLTSEICSNSTISPNVCFASAAGIYEPDSSSTSLDGLIQFPAVTDFSHGGLRIQGSDGIGSLDQIDIGISSATRNSVIVPNVTIAHHDDVNILYPDGSTPALEVGTLGLGYLGTENQTFQNPGSSSINGSLIPGYLQAQGAISSNSFGLHIGSVKPKISGSLFFGGYDQSRLIGDITTQQGAFAGIEGQDAGSVGFIDLLDIQLNVIDGYSPWNITNVTNLLAAGNSSIGASLPVSMRPESPYLDLPQSTCDALAAWLPVTYQEGLGLYTWNTNDPQYTKIVSSPSVLTFVFRKDQLNSANITINVPFMLLNLTLQAPLTTVPTPYFPCNAQSYGRYSLGRAFLQAAFVGTNWNANDNQGVWWMAQAPGPNIGSQSSIQVIADDDTTISASGNSWIASWKETWTPLQQNSVNDSTTTLPSLPTSTSNSSGTATAEANNGLSTGGKIAIGVSVPLVFLAALAVGVFFFMRRRRSANEKGASGQVSSTGDLGAMREALQRSNDHSSLSTSEIYQGGGYGPAELTDNTSRNRYGDVTELHSNPVKPVYEIGPS